MQRKVSRLILLVIIIALTFTNIAYAQQTNESAPYGPRVEDLKDKDDIIKNLDDMRRIRSNLIVINISENSTPEQLESINKDVDYYIEQFDTIRKNLENHRLLYKDSFPDVFFSEQISFVADSFIISLRQQQNLIRALEANKDDSKKLFYSNYLIPIYFYLNLGDQMTAYIETYLVIS